MTAAILPFAANLAGLRGSPPQPATSSATLAFGASLLDMTPWPARTPSGAPSAPDAMTAIDLLAGIDAARWVARDQHGDPDCVSHAVVACVELLRARGGKAPEQLSARFVDAMIRARRKQFPAGTPGIGPKGVAATKLCEAAMVLEAIGACPNSRFDDAAPASSAPPGPAVVAEASTRRCKAMLYQDRPLPADRGPGLARRVHAELRQGRPVAIALPGFGATAKATPSWARPATWRTGVLPDPGEADVPIPSSGHAVCVVGYRPGKAAPGEGHFIFRNSWGRAFGRLAGDPFRPAGIPAVPMAGYGAISARHLDALCWEAASFALA